MDIDLQKAADAMYATARWLFDTGRIREAADVFRAMATCAPREERAWLGLGVCHEQLEQHEIALQIYAVGQAAAGPAPRCAMAMALIYRDLGDAEAFQEVLETARLAAERRCDDELANLIEMERTQS